MPDYTETRKKLNADLQKDLSTIAPGALDLKQRILQTY